MFVSFQRTDKNGGWGFGQTIVDSSVKIQTAEDIEEVRKQLLDKNPEAKEIIIINWIHLQG